MHRIINHEAIQKINDAICEAEKTLEKYPQITKDYKSISLYTTFSGISQQIDAFKEPHGLIWYLWGYDIKRYKPMYDAIAVHIKQHEYVTVRKDILHKLYEAIDEVTDMLHEGKDIAFGNVMEARDELECGKTYEDLGRNREIINSRKQ